MGQLFNLASSIVRRALPAAYADDASVDRPARGGRYGELYTAPIVRKSHLLADEGSYFVTNNAQTGITTGTSATFSATAALCTIFNNDSAGGKRIYIDYCALITTAAGGWASAGVNTQLAVYLDNGDRYSSGGTSLTAAIACPNKDVTPASIALVRFGAVTATAATSAVRAICGLRILRPAVSTTVADVVGETKMLNFGCVEQMLNGSITVASANNIPIGLPPIVIGPQQSAVLYYILNGTTPSAAGFAPEIGWWER